MKRVDYLDYARALGIFLVYFGHFSEKLYRLGNIDIVLPQWKAVYSFHMPLFFFLAGIFWKREPLTAEFFSSKLKTRLVPWAFFSLMLAPFWFVLSRDEFWNRVFTGGYLIGTEQFNILMWFVICLFVVELIAAWIARYLKTNSLHLIIYAALSFCFGYYVMIGKDSDVAAFIGFHPRVWYLDDAFIALLFYLSGYLLKDFYFKLNEAKGWWISLLVALAAGVALWYTYDLNEVNPIVQMISSKYGDALPFLLAAFSGIFFLVAFSRLLPQNLRPLSFVGQNTLVFMGLNGFGQHFLDRQVILRGMLPPIATQWQAFLYTSVYVILIMILSSPVVIALRRWFPELVGFAWTPTSLLPPMREWNQHGVGKGIHLFLQRYLIN